MARPPRLELPGVPLHVVQRGVNRASCFFSDIDRRFYLTCLKEAAESRGCAAHAYVLMSNHVHLLLTPLEAGAASATLQDVGRRYVRVVNTIHGRTGTLWEGRYKSSLVDSETYFLACHRYIELNPVRGGIVENPAQYAWSSHAHYAFGRRDPLLTEHVLYNALGATADERQATYLSLFDNPLASQTVTAIRGALNSDSALGAEQFLSRTEAVLGRSVRIPKRGRPAKVVTGKLL